MTGKRVRRSLWYYVGLGLSWGVLGLVVGLAAILVLVPAAAGATPLTVLTSSMEPHLPPGTSSWCGRPRSKTSTSAAS